VYTQLLAVKQDQLQGDIRVLKNLTIGGIGLGWTELLGDAVLYCALLKNCLQVTRLLRWLC
jgi:hypothetical protein